MTTPEPADWRRAAALITHRASSDAGDVHDGVRVILEEAVTRGRMTALLQAVDAAYRVWIEQLRNDRSRELINDLIDEQAETQPDPYTRRAAKAIKALRTQDGPQLNALLEEVNADPAGDGGARLIGATADVYAFVLPELATRRGHEELAAWTTDIARYDDGSA